MKPSFRTLLPTVLSLGFLGVASPFAGAATPREELLRLVPSDMAFCLVVGNLRDNSDQLHRSEWFKRFQQSALWKAMTASPDLKMVERALNQDLQKALQIDWPRLRDDILGDAVVLAYRPASKNQPRRESGLFLLWARDAQLLAILTERLNRVQLASGEVKAIREHQYQGKRYFERVESRPDRFVYYPVSSPMQLVPVTVPLPETREQYYFLDGPVLAAGPDRDLLFQVMQARAQPLAAKASPLFDQMLRAGANDALIAWWMNPRVFDAEWQKAAGAPGQNATTMKTFQRYWLALDALVVCLKVNPDFQMALSLQARPEALPPAFRRFVETLSQPSELWRRFPPESVLALAFQLDASALGEMASEILAPDARAAGRQMLQTTLGAAMGMNLEDRMLPKLGPDVGAFVAAAPEPTRFPHLLAALRVQRDSGATSLDGSLVQALRFFATLAIFDHNRRTGDGLRLESMMQDKVEVSYVAGGGGFPAGFQPAVALKEGYLLLASTPDAISRFHPREGVPTNAKDNTIVRLSVPRLVRLLEDQKETIAALAAEKDPTRRQNAGQLLNNVQDTLALFERLEVSVRADSGQMELALRLHRR